jgi:hypothetical protein
MESAADFAAATAGAWIPLPRRCRVVSTWAFCSGPATANQDHVGRNLRREISEKVLGIWGNLAEYRYRFQPRLIWKGIKAFGRHLRILRVY